MSEPKRHHYLPEFYLEGFCRDGLLWLYDREKREFRQQSPKNTAVQSYYYSLVDYEGAKDSGVEKMLSQVEGLAKPLRDKLLARGKLTTQERAEFALFVALMMNRVPDFEKSMNKIAEDMARRIADIAFGDEKRASATMQSLEKKTGVKPDVSAKEMVDFQERGQYEIRANRNLSLKAMVELSAEAACLFAQMDWQVWHAHTKAAFVTTDNPVVILPPKDHRPDSMFSVGLISEGAKKLFPLSKEAMLVMRDRGESLQHADVPRPITRALNAWLAGHSDRFVLASSEALLASIVDRFKLGEWKRQGRFKIS